MITELKVGFQVEKRGFVFTLGAVYMSVQNLDGDLMAILSLMDDSGNRVVRNEEQFLNQIDFWLSENL